MKVLLSAYSCRPNEGSEAGKSWRWAEEIAALGHEVRVLTCAANGPSIARAQAPRGVQFHLHDMRQWRRTQIGGSSLARLHYALWQFSAARTARRLHEAEGFDLVHHISWATVRFPSRMGTLGILLGPVGGGEHTPWSLRRSLPFGAQLTEVLRDASNALLRLGPVARSSAATADLVLVTTRETFTLLPASVRGRTRIDCALGAPAIVPAERPTASGGTRFLFAPPSALEGDGAWSSRICKGQCRAPGHSTNDGRQRARTPRVGTACGRAGHRARRRVAWLVGAGGHDQTLWRARRPVVPKFPRHGGHVIFEAAAHGLPVICLDLGSPGTIVTDRCGVVVSTARRSADEVCDALAQAIVEASDRRWVHAMRQMVAQWANEQTWARRVGAIYGKGGTAEALVAGRPPDTSHAGNAASNVDQPIIS